MKQFFVRARYGLTRLLSATQTRTERLSIRLRSLVDRRLRRRRFDELVKKNPSLRQPLRSQYVQEIQHYWKRNFGRAINPRWHQVCTNVLGQEDVRYIPKQEWWNDILPALNERSMSAAYSDKNLYDRLVNDASAPRTILKRVNGRYYDGANRAVPQSEAFERILAQPQECIIKPSRTNNGKLIGRLTVGERRATLGSKPVGLAEIEERYRDNFIIQSKIIQHPTMASVHPDSVNTIRLVTFRWQCEIRFLLAFARFGSSGSINDNLGTGGLCCGIDDTGRLHDTALDAYCRSYTTHPTSGYRFATRDCVPSFDRIKMQAVDLHTRLLHFDIVSWDIAVGHEGDPIFVEANFRGYVYLYQCAARRPLFGDLTAPVLEAVQSRHARI